MKITGKLDSVHSPDLYISKENTCATAVGSVSANKAEGTQVVLRVPEGKRCYHYAAGGTVLYHRLECALIFTKLPNDR
ncbi:MAG: hypothetical protein K8R19_05370 [Methanosarcinales archaeon]|nr:hypothetical protein [Methanosarcinales archaeon]